jgi:hypothetical protein
MKEAGNEGCLSTFISCLFLLFDYTFPFKTTFTPLNTIDKGEIVSYL